MSLKEKEALIDTLLNFDDRCNSFFTYQTYFLAAEAIALFPNSSQADSIVDQLLKWSYPFCRTSKSDWKTYPQALTIAAREALKRTDIKRVANRLAEVIHTTDSLFVLRCAAEELGRLNPGDESAIAALEQLIQYPQSFRNRFKAVTSLIAIDPQNPVITSTLIEIANADLDLADSRAYAIFRDVICKLREVESGNEIVIAAIVDLLHRWQQLNDEQASSHYVHLCNWSAETLSLIGIENPVAISTLIDLVQQSKCYPDEFYPSSCYFGWYAVNALGRIAVGNSSAIAKLSSLLIDAQEPLLRCHIAAALLGIDSGNPIAIAVLSEILETVQLERQEPSPQIDHRLHRLQEYLLWRASDSLSRNDPNCQNAIDILIQLVQTSISDTPCLPVLYSLLEIDSTKQLAINALIQLVETKPDDFLSEVLSIFRSVEVGNQAVINALTRLIQRSQSSSNRYAAAGALGVVDPGNSLAIETLIELLDPDDSYWSIAQQLGQFGMSDEQAIAALLKFVQTFRRTSDRRDRQRLTDCFKHLKSKELLAYVVQELKDYLDPKHTDLDDDQFESGAYFEWEDVEGVRSEVVYQIIWNCAQNMSYPDFYQAWTGERL